MKERVRIDSVTSRTALGGEWINKFINKLEGKDKRKVKIEKIEAICQFGGGKRQKSVMKIGLPWRIGDVKVTLLTEVYVKSI